MRLMWKAMSMPLTLALACFITLGCRNHHLEKSFFDKPAGDRVERLRQYSLADQCRAFLARRRGGKMFKGNGKSQRRDGGLKMDWTKPLQYRSGYGC
jgi:hypothetical protein